MIAILTHDNCIDGKTSAFIAIQYCIENQLKYEHIPVSYNKEFPELNPDVTLVYVLDFSYPKEIFDSLNDRNIDVVMLDHHKTAADMYGGYGDYSFMCGGHKTTVVIKEDESGALLTFKYFRSRYLSQTNNQSSLDRVKYVVDRVSDRDLWKFNFPDSKDINSLLNSIPNTFEDWRSLLIDGSDDEFQDQLKVSKVRTETIAEVCVSLAKYNKPFILNGLDCVIANVPVRFSSDVGSILSATNPFSVTYCIGNDKIYVSLRTKSDNINLAELAEKYNGGGHTKASGFSLPIESFNDFISGKL